MDNVSAKRRILVADDEAENRRLISEFLTQSGFVVESACSGNELLNKVEAFGPELVLLDYNMPGLSGLETLNALRQRQNYVAVVFVSANQDENLIVECLGQGADDYVRKPFRFSELLARVNVRFRIKDLNDALFKANLRLQELAVTDDLTGLFNMRDMYAKIDHELRRARRYDRKVACIMMDIDKFKEVNDKNDHLFGSFVIKELGKIIQKNMRDTDFAARYGGDEFLMVLTETTDEGVFAFADRLRKRISAYQFSDGKNSIQRTCSFGFAVSDSKEQIDARELVRRADHALYAAKSSGRNRVEGKKKAQG